MTAVNKDFNTIYSALCKCNKTLYTTDRVETFHGHDRRRVLPERMCDIKTGEAISRYASVH